jgi:hypothetical protein
MKKIIFFSVLLLFASILHAQQKTIHKPTPIPVQPKPQPPDKWFGIFAGPNLNYLNYSDKSTTIGGSNTGLHAGIFFQKISIKNLPFSLRSYFRYGGEIRNIDSTMQG